MIPHSYSCCVNYLPCLAPKQRRSCHSIVKGVALVTCADFQAPKRERYKTMEVADTVKAVNAGAEDEKPTEGARNEGDALSASFSSFLGKPIEICIVCNYPPHNESITPASKTPVSCSNTCTISHDGALIIITSCLHPIFPLIYSRPLLSTNTKHHIRR